MIRPKLDKILAYKIHEKKVKQELHLQTQLKLSQGMFNQVLQYREEKDA